MGKFVEEQDLEREPEGGERDEAASLDVFGEQHERREQHRAVAAEALDDPAREREDRRRDGERTERGAEAPPTRGGDER
jgi:hypothetical protein